MTTVLTQIEALLNSRPLCVLNSDPSELAPLTLFHFLLQMSLAELPAPQVTKITNRLSLYQLIGKIVQDFWKIWRLEYLPTLQSREKWNPPSNQDWLCSSNKSRQMMCSAVFLRFTDQWELFLRFFQDLIT